MEKQTVTPSPVGATVAAVPAVWQVGDVILEQYEVTGTLGEGGMGTVYKVHHRGWNIDLAVKSPKPEIFVRAGGKENFIREAETWVNLGLHPHIVSCYYVRTLGGIPRVFAEYVADGSLSDWIHTRRLYEGGHEKALERMLDVAIQFAWGLHYAHEQGLIHQDVKPANVMMTADGTAKVTDFGLAKARAVDGEAGVEGTGQSILVSSRGMTPAYCSPEQYAGWDVSRKTDIWSWGVSVLEMFVGEVTWQVGAVAAEVLASHEAQDPAIPVMPTSVVKLLAHCFRPRPEDRPATMLEVATELQTIYARLVGHPYPREAPKPAEALADSLNNRALSLYDLGKVEEAKQVWEQALAADPPHMEVNYNRGIVLWRQGELTDEMLVQQLERVRATHAHQWQAIYLLALVHVERGDGDTALSQLREAVQRAPAETEVQGLLEQVQSGAFPLWRCLRVFQGLTNEVTSVSLSADGRLALFLSADGRLSSDKTVSLWEVATGQCLRTFQRHTASVTSMRLSADGRLALSVDFFRTVGLWEVATGHRLRTFQGHTNQVTSVSLSADDRLALSGSSDRTIRLWEVATGQCLRVFQGHTNGVTSVSLSADGRLALSGSSDRTIRLWEVATGRCLRDFQGHTAPVMSVSLSADGRLALSGSSDRTIRLWEVATGRCLRVFQGHTNGVTSVSLSADGRLALSGGLDAVRLWEVATGRCLRTFQGQVTISALFSGFQVCLSADGHLALWAGGTGWEMPHGRFFCPLRPSQVQSYADVSHAEARVAVLLQQAEHALEEARFASALDLVRRVRAMPGWERSPRSLEMWGKLSQYCRRVGLRTVWLARTFAEHTTSVTSVSLSADVRLALSGSSDKTVRLWEVATGRCLRVLQGHTKGVQSVSLSADSRLALSGSSDTSVRLWEVATGRCLRIFQGHTNEVTSVSLSADGRLALSGGSDKTVRLWEVATGQCLRTFRGHSIASVKSVSLSADGRFALSGGLDTSVRLWEVATGRCLRVLQGHTKGVQSVSLSADGRFALSESADWKIRLWDTTTGQCLRVLQGHIGEVSSVSLSADGRFALSGGSNKPVRLWEVATGQCLRTFQDTGWVTSVSLSADGRFALSGSSDKTVRLWELDWELEASASTDWDEGALPYLETFLTQHTPYAGVLLQDREPSKQEIQQGLTRRGNPTWNEQDFQDLICQLQYAGYGWLRQEGVRRQLAEMAASRQGPPPLVETQSSESPVADTSQVRQPSLWSRLFRQK